MKPSVKGWAVAAQQQDLKMNMRTNKDLTFEQRKRKLGDVYSRKADSKEEKKSVVAQIMFFADIELCEN